MSNEPTEFRDRLFNAQRVTPALRDVYEHELDSILNETHTPRTRLPAVVLMLSLFGVAIAIVISLFFHTGALFYSVSALLFLTCGFGGAWIARDLWRGKVARRQSYRFAELFYTAAAILTVIALITGVSKSSDPATTFGALFPIVWLGTSLGFCLINRIAMAEIAAKEQMLRIECRLADLAERLPK